jgi:UDP-glucose 4-epimerase
MKISKILLIGANGFIGSELTKTLNSNYKIFKISKKSRFKYRLKETEKIIKLINKYKIDTVLHSASKLFSLSNKKNYLIEKKKIINPSKKIFSYLAKEDKNLIFISSAGTIYGDQKYVTENSELKPKNYLGKSKKELEKFILGLHETQKLNYLILRPSNVYGKKKNINSKQGLIENVVNKLKKKKKIKIRNEGKDSRDYLFINDFCEVVKKLFKKKIINEIINISSGYNYKTIQVVKIIENILKQKAKIEIIKKRNIKDVKNISISNKKVKILINHNFKNLKKGLKLFV